MIINNNYAFSHEHKYTTKRNGFVGGFIPEFSGVKKIRIHDLRHSHASLLISKLGAQPNLVADRLGHEKIQTTLSTYSHIYPEQSRQLAEQLNMLVENEDEE